MRNNISKATMGIFIIGAKHTKVNSGKHVGRIIFQQAISGLHYPPQANQQIFKYQQETYESDKQPKTINKPIAIIPEEVLLLPRCLPSNLFPLHSATSRKEKDIPSYSHQQVPSGFLSELSSSSKKTSSPVRLACQAMP